MSATYSKFPLQVSLEQFRDCYAQRRESRCRRSSKNGDGSCHWIGYTYRGIALILGLAIASATAYGATSSSQNVPPTASIPDRAAEGYGKLPLSFEANQGQAGSGVRFLSRGSGYSLFLTDKSAILALGSPAVCQTSTAAPETTSTPCNAKASSPRDIVRMELAHANPAVQIQGRITGEDPLPGKVNYFLGNDPAKWRTGIPTYAKVQYKNVYDGIDLVYYGNQRQLEYDFVVAPGADPARIRMNFTGQEHLSLAANGDLILQGSGGQATLHKPVIYQEKNGRRQPIQGSFQLAANHSVSFRLGSYDHAHGLIIDPVLAYSTYLGGSTHDQGNGIVVDSLGNAYVVGTTRSADFPITGEPFQAENNSTVNGTVFVTKLNANGTALIYSTYLGGSAGDFGYGIALDPADNVYVTGATYSTDFPITCGAIQTTNGAASNSATTAFVTMLNPSSNVLTYSTYLGGSTQDVSQAITVDSLGNAYVTGYTYSANFPVTDEAFQTQFRGSPSAANAFTSKLNPGGTALVYSTFLGGSGSNGAGDYGNAIAIDAKGDAFVAGSTTSSDFPVTNGSFQPTLLGSSNAFVTELNSAGKDEVFSTYLGGSGSLTYEGLGVGDSAQTIALDKDGFPYVAGNTESTDFPLTTGVLENENIGIGGYSEVSGIWLLNFANGAGAFVTKLKPDGSGLEYSTYLEGPGTSITGMAVDISGSAYVVGTSPTVGSGIFGGFQQTPDALPLPGGAISGFLVKLSPSASVLNYASFLGGNYNDYATSVALDTFGNAYLTGLATSTTFPTTYGAFQTANKAQAGNAFVAKFAVAAAANQTPYASPPSTSIGTSLSGVVNVSIDCEENEWSYGATVTLNTDAYGPPPTGFIGISVDNAYSPVALANGESWGGGGAYSGGFGEFDPPWGDYYVNWSAIYSGDAVYAASSGSGYGTGTSCPYPPGLNSRPSDGSAPKLKLNLRNALNTGSSNLVKLSNSLPASATRAGLNSATAAKYNVQGPKFIPTPIGSILTGRGQRSTEESRPQVQGAPACIAPKPSLTVSLLPAAGSRLYGAANPKFTYTVSGLLKGDSVTVTPATTATSASPVGSYPVTATVTGTAAANYSVYVADATLTVLPAPLTVTIHGDWKTYGSANPSFAVSTSGLLNGDIVSVTPHTTATAASPVGDYPVTATVTGPVAANYNIKLIPATLSVFKALLHVEAKNEPVTYGHTPAQPTAYQIYGFVNGDTASVVSGQPTLSTSVTSTTPVGTYLIQVQVTGVTAANYDFTNIGNGEGSVQVYKAVLTATADNKTMPKGGPIPPLTYTLTGFVNGDTATTAVTGSPDMFTTATLNSPPGRYTISGTLGTLASHNYDFKPVTGIMTVLP